jgi:hypothetical protein
MQDYDAWRHVAEKLPNNANNFGDVECRVVFKLLLITKLLESFIRIRFSRAVERLTHSNEQKQEEITFNQKTHTIRGSRYRDASRRCVPA